MPTDNVQFNNKLSPQELAKARNQAEFINKKHQADGKSYGEGLGKDSFLQLLVTELTHQDPTNPMQDRDFIAQMAQFSSLEQMTNVNTQISELNSRGKLNEAYSLIGKRVQALDAQRGIPVDGTVSHVVRRQGEIRVVVDKYECRVDDVHAVFPSPQEIQKSSQTLKTDTDNQPVKNAPVIDSNVNTQKSTPEMDFTTTEKGVRNSFNEFYNYYDNNINGYSKAAKSYSAY
ncbi:MAG TPA: flagellar hook capping FlgD N-terminal domain-containing protein [Spirochaetota bacterium]|nr:flagellar hook capping FlgD N-terminal domain-containing protein [Spirochaetota bacterium]